MALKATIYKANIELADMDRHYYDSLNLTIAKHPSETEKRLMVRLIAFLLNAQPELTFGKGVSNEDEAAISHTDYNGTIALWIELGNLDEKRLKKACTKAKEVKLYCYDTSTPVWWSQNAEKFKSYNNLTIEEFTPDTVTALEKLADRNMEFQVSIQDSQLWLTSGDETLLVTTKQLK
ncbi:YaeQ family protein [Litorilituus sediminis]|uniref:YaeQ family protein n=1 Tax=Litorilituus sediminis TaxID=718192 RepID=A0A4P6P1T3_9GAMM|nr:YaeQ family protein [Litorilituus sediminis]QBG34974.1 YaeQ family protein [Litorilituus sediminis]